jgi:hypothetical protein
MQLEDLLDPAAEDGWNQSFVERFVRPNGLDKPCAPLVADDLERVFREAPRVEVDASSVTLRVLLEPFVAFHAARRRMNEVRSAAARRGKKRKKRKKSFLGAPRVTLHAARKRLTNARRAAILRRRKRRERTRARAFEHKESA